MQKIKRPQPQKDLVNKSNSVSARKKTVFPSNPKGSSTVWQPNRRNK